MAKSKKISEWATPFGLAAILIALVTFYKKWTTPNMFMKKEGFVSKKCPDGTRSDGPCLMEFPSF